MSQGVRREPRKSPRRKINNFSKYFFMHRMYGWRSFFPIVLSIHFSFSFITGKQDAAYPSNSIQLGNKAVSGSYIFIRWFRIFQTSRNQDIVKATVFGVFEDLKFKISEGSDQNWSCPDSALLAVSVNIPNCSLHNTLIPWSLKRFCIA